MQSDWQFNFNQSESLKRGIKYAEMIYTGSGHGFDRVVPTSMTRCWNKK